MKNLILFILLQAVPAIAWTSVYSPTQIGTNSGGNDIATYTYDTAGNRLSRNQDQSLSIDLIGKPTAIRTVVDGTEVTESIRYGTRGQRYLRVHEENGATVKTFYLDGGAMEYRIPTSGSPQSVVYVRRGQYSPIAQIDISATSPQYHYYLRDHLGTPLRMVNNSGNAESLMRHDVWGQPTSATGVATTMQDQYRVFTGHENLASANLIHMNGRVYDPLVGFVSPDPVIEPKVNFPNLMRYGYLNNQGPNGTDPNGYQVVKDDLGVYRMTVLNKDSEDNIFHSEEIVNWQSFEFEPMSNGGEEEQYMINAIGFDNPRLEFQSVLEKHFDNHISLTLSELTTASEHERFAPKGTGTQTIVDTIDMAEHVQNGRSINSIILKNLTERSFVEKMHQTPNVESMSPGERASIFSDTAWAHIIRNAADRKGYSIKSQKISGQSKTWKWEFELSRINGYHQDQGPVSKFSHFLEGQSRTGFSIRPRIP